MKHFTVLGSFPYYFDFDSIRFLNLRCELRKLYCARFLDYYAFAYYQTFKMSILQDLVVWGFMFVCLAISLTWIIWVYFGSVLHLKHILSHHDGRKTI